MAHTAGLDAACNTYEKFLEETGNSEASYVSRVGIARAIGAFLRAWEPQLAIGPAGTFTMEQLAKEMANRTADELESTTPG